MIVNDTDKDEDIELSFEGNIREVKIIDSFRMLSPIGDAMPNVAPKQSVLLLEIDL